MLVHVSKCLKWWSRTFMNILKNSNLHVGMFLGFCWWLVWWALQCHVSGKWKVSNPMKIGIIAILSILKLLDDHTRATSQRFVLYPQMSNVEGETPESWHLGMIPRKLSCNEVSISNSYMIRWICGSVILNACWTWICEFHVTVCLKLSQQIKGLEGELGPCWASQWFLIGTLLAGFLCYVQRPGLSSVLMYSLNIIHCGFLWQSSTPKSV